MKWEYYLCTNLSGLPYTLNAMGAVGWELVCATTEVNTTHLIFKRPLDAASPPSKELK